MFRYRKEIVFSFLLYLTLINAKEIVKNQTNNTMKLDNSNKTIPLSDVDPYAYNFWNSFASGFGIVFISALGDKTFFLVMIYGATNSLAKSFFLSLLVMLLLNLLNLLLGFAAPFLMYRGAIDWLAITLFTFFGVKMLIDGFSNESKPIESELEELKKSIAHSRIHSHTHIQHFSVDKQIEFVADKDKVSFSPKNDDKQFIDFNESNLKEHLLPKDMPDEHVVTFDSYWAYASSLIIAECGDKSQIATIVIGALHNFWGVLLGSSLAQVCSISLAIFLGALISKKLTNKELSIGGGIIFLSFAIAYLLDKINVY